jgi:tetratricopeptide (TPR) repeat protein
MRKTLVWCGLALSILAVSTTFVIAQGKRQPVSDREVLALVAGNSLSEDIADEIAARGISFRPSEQFRALVIQAGGDTRVTTAIERAKTVQAGSDGAPPASEQLLQHLSSAGKQIRVKKYEEAAQELSAALQSGAGPEAGFVMGETLQRQEDWTGAANMYAEVLHRDSSFTAAQIKLSYVLYHLGDGEAALREARAALTRLPASPEAHRYAGIAFDTLRKRDAAEKEYREAIRLKPDYAAAYYNLGIFFGGIAFP